MSEHAGRCGKHSSAVDAHDVPLRERVPRPLSQSETSIVKSCIDKGSRGREHLPAIADLEARRGSIPGGEMSVCPPFAACSLLAPTFNIYVGLS